MVPKMFLKLQPLIVISNHASYFDPLIVSNCVRRPVAYMAKEELFNVPVLAQVMKLYGAYPVNRGTPDRSAIRSALESLEQGWAVGVFLEGTRTPDGRINDPKTGCIITSRKSKGAYITRQLICYREDFTQRFDRSPSSSGHCPDW